jgi:hypothetical protein
MSRQTFTATVSVTLEGASELYTSETLAGDVRELVLEAIQGDYPEQVVIVTVEAGE